MKIEELKPAIKNLEDLYIMKASASTAYSEAIKAAALTGQVSKKSLNRLIKARVENKEASENQDANEFIDLLESLDI